MMRCPVELTGRYSVIPSTRPRMIAWRMFTLDLSALALAGHHAALADRFWMRTVADGRPILEPRSIVKPRHQRPHPRTRGLNGMRGRCTTPSGKLPVSIFKVRHESPSKRAAADIRKQGSQRCPKMLVDKLALCDERSELCGV